ncbi:putative invertase inhibitor [Phalaenopsis equestris]|uniref:putative invertase inhibitor n=1 Tax=Phalaenopsis equestris TaxID=78828 RepID=UPI0009E3F140|nr:putative invertase inhibitor [Phalaenopsis equestris]
MSPFYLPIFLLLLLHKSSITTASSIIEQTCRRCAQTDPALNYNLCVGLLNSNPNSRNADLSGLGVISLSITRAKSIQIQSTIQNLMKSNPSSKYVRECLTVCLELYTDATSLLSDSMRAIQSGRISDARTWISAAMDAGTTCADGFEERGLVSPLKKRNDEYRSRVLIPLAIAALLDGN